MDVLVNHGAVRMTQHCPLPRPFTTYQQIFVGSVCTISPTWAAAASGSEGERERERGRERGEEGEAGS